MDLKNSLRRLTLCLMACLLLCTVLLPAVSLADAGRWESAADEIDKYCDEAFEYYLAGDASKAYSSVNSAYFKVYEVTGMERQTLTYVSGPRKNSVELQFSACKGAVKKSNETVEDKTAVRTELNKLKSMIREDANKLAVKDGEPASVTKYYLNGQLVDSDPYADLAGDPNAKQQYASWTEAYDAVAELLDTAYTAFKGGDPEAALDNLNTAYYTVYEESGLSHEIFTGLSLEDRQAVDAEFETLRGICTEGKNRRTAFQNQCKKVKRVLSAKAASLDQIKADAAAAAAA